MTTESAAMTCYRRSGKLIEREIVKTISVSSNYELRSGERLELL